MDKLFYERQLIESGCKFVCGADEAGRGPLAGPVVCAAVIMPYDDIIEGVDDSKRLSPKRREELYGEIISRAVAYNICRVEAEEIDRINILEATKLCMKRAVEGLEVKADYALCDGNMKLSFACPYQSIVKGDAKSYTIGAASIIAKVFRDRLMTEYDLEFPGYGFAANKGYGTAAHIQALKQIGPCPLHRRTFIKNFGF